MLVPEAVNSWRAVDRYYIVLEEASTQKSAKIHVGNVSVNRDLDL